MYRSNGLFFHKKSLNMGLIFYKNIPKHGYIAPEFLGVEQHKKDRNCPGGYQHIKTYMDVPSNGLLFHKKSLNMLPIFYKKKKKKKKKIPKHVSTDPKFLDVCDNCEKLAYISRKNL